MNDWPKYQSHKVIQANRIVAFEVTTDGVRAFALVRDPETSDLEQFKPTIAEMLVKAQIGDYAMLYPDGFKSVCPEAQFEDGYSNVTGDAT